MKGIWNKSSYQGIKIIEVQVIESQSHWNQLLNDSTCFKMYDFYWIFHNKDNINEKCYLKIDYFKFL